MPDPCSAEARWCDICALEEIWPYTGLCARLGDQQIALFRLPVNGQERVFALQNHDPFSSANVLSRGLLGNLGERLVVASPMYKQHFDLITGECVEEPQVSLHTWPVRIVRGRVEVQA